MMGREAAAIGEQERHQGKGVGVVKNDDGDGGEENRRRRAEVAKLGERRAAELDELYERARQSKSYWADEDETAAWARLRAQEERERRKKMN